MGYLSNFVIYMLAMVGIIMLALFLFKYTTGSKMKSIKNPAGLKVTDTLSLSPRKTLYVVETGGEKFLIAGDTDRTTLISKLGTKQQIPPEYNIKERELYADNNDFGIHSTQKSPYQSVMRSLAERIK